MKKYFLTIDNGGTRTKVVICDEVGKQIAVHSFLTKGIEPEPGFHEINLIKLRQDLLNAIRDILKSVEISANEIVGISTIGHGKGLYVLDRDRKVFLNGILSADSRASEYAKKFQKKVAEIYPISKQQVLASQAPVILRWLKDYRKDQYEQIGYVLSNKDFVRFLLTGKVLQEIGDASGNNLINLNSQKYDARLLNFFGIPEMEACLPSLIRCTDVVGTISESIANETGLNIDTPVYGGMFDIDACTIATGVLDDQYISMVAGTWNINVFPSSLPADEASHLMNSIFPTGDILIEASSPTSAGNLDIMLKTLMTTEIRDAHDQGKSIYDDLESFLENTDAKFSKVFFLPFLYGSNVNPDAESAFIGLRSTTTKSEMIRAVYEGVVFAHKYHLEKLLNSMENVPHAVRLSGGATNSDSWIQMFADILNMRIEISDVKELGGLGGAIASAVGSQTYLTLQDAVDKMAHIKKVFIPNQVQSEIYEIKYKGYLKILEALDQTWTFLKQDQVEIDAYDN